MRPTDSSDLFTGVSFEEKDTRSRAPLQARVRSPAARIGAKSEAYPPYSLPATLVTIARAPAPPQLTFRSPPVLLLEGFAQDAQEELHAVGRGRPGCTCFRYDPGRN